MSLEDLTQYAPTQTAAINDLLRVGCFSTSEVTLFWTEFKESVWKKGSASFQAQEPVERDDEPVEDSCIPLTLSLLQRRLRTSLLP
jgi:hypothetical protein